MNPGAIALVGAPSSIGLRPYDDGMARHLDRAPGALRERGLASRLGAADLGNVEPPPYKDFVRPGRGARNEHQVAQYSRRLGEKVAAATIGRRFAIVLGGDCSIVLGCLLGARRTAGTALGLVYVDAHADFATAEESPTGSVAGMGLALASGRGTSPLARLGRRGPLVEPGRIVLLGRRDFDDRAYGHDALAASGILDITDSDLIAHPPADVTERTLERVAADGLDGFWVHVDADVLNPAVMPAVDSPEPGGLLPGDLAELLRPLVHHPRALGLSLTIYDPALDPDRACARRLVRLLETLFAATPLAA
jgi:arginase